MKKFLRPFILAIAFVAPSAAAIAATPIVQGADWGGFYGGLFAGSGEKTYTYRGRDYASTEINPLGLFLGTQFQRSVGHQNMALVFGGEVSASAGNGAWRYFSIAETGRGAPVLVDVKLRGGVAFSNLLLYGFGGMSYYENIEAVSGSNTIYLSHGSGSNIGLGAQYKFGNGLFLGSEYIVRKLDVEYASPPSPDVALSGATLSVRLGWQF